MKHQPAFCHILSYVYTHVFSSSKRRGEVGHFRPFYFYRNIEQQSMELNQRWHFSSLNMNWTNLYKCVSNHLIFSNIRANPCYKKALSHSLSLTHSICMSVPVCLFSTLRYFSFLSLFFPGCFFHFIAFNFH